MPPRTNLAQHVLKASSGLMSTATDMVLATIYCLGEFATTPRSHWSTVDLKTQTHLEHVNAQTLARALRHLIQNQLVTSTKTETPLSFPHITSAGLTKLSHLLPHYRLKRPWHGKFYLINYDLPTSRNSDRTYLRLILQHLGCAKLQYSTWLTPYDPDTFLSKSIDLQNLKLMAISQLNSSVGIGTTHPKNLVAQLYPLGKLNHRYQDFIKSTHSQLNPSALAFSYWSILRDDPQLPFELLPTNWSGSQAYQTFCRHTHMA